MTPGLTDCSQASLQRLHEIAHRSGWDEIKTDARAAFAENHKYHHHADE